MPSVTGITSHERQLLDVWACDLCNLSFYHEVQTWLDVPYKPDQRLRRIKIMVGKFREIMPPTFVDAERVGALLDLIEREQTPDGLRRILNHARDIVAILRHLA